MTQRKHRPASNILSTVISIVALGISLWALKDGCEATKISKAALELNSNIQRARLSFDLLALNNPKIKVQLTEAGLRISGYIPVRNKGKSPAKIIFYKTSILPESWTGPVFDDKTNLEQYPDALVKSNPFLIEANDEFGITASSELRLSNRDEINRIKQEIEEGSVRMKISVELNYIDVVTNRQHSLFFDGYCGRSSLSLLSYKDE